MKNIGGTTVQLAHDAAHQLAIETARNCEQDNVSVYNEAYEEVFRVVYGKLSSLETEDTDK